MASEAQSATLRNELHSTASASVETAAAHAAALKEARAALAAELAAAHAEALMASEAQSATLRNELVDAHTRIAAPLQDRIVELDRDLKERDGSIAQLRAQFGRASNVREDEIRTHNAEVDALREAKVRLAEDLAAGAVEAERAVAERNYARAENSATRDEARHAARAATAAVAAERHRTLAVVEKLEASLAAAHVAAEKAAAQKSAAQKPVAAAAPAPAPVEEVPPALPTRCTRSAASALGPKPSAKAKPKPALKPKLKQQSPSASSTRASTPSVRERAASRVEKAKQNAKQNASAARAALKRVSITAVSRARSGSARAVAKVR